MLYRHEHATYTILPSRGRRIRRLVLHSPLLCRLFPSLGATLMGSKGIVPLPIHVPVQVETIYAIQQRLMS